MLVGLEMDARPMIALVHLPPGVALGVLYFQTRGRGADMLAVTAPLEAAFGAMALPLARRGRGRAGRRKTVSRLG